MVVHADIVDEENFDDIEDSVTGVDNETEVDIDDERSRESIDIEGADVWSLISVDIVVDS